MKKTIFIYLIIFTTLTISCLNSQTVVLTPDASNVEINSRQIKSTVVINQTFLGNEQRNYYGNEAPDNLEINWTCLLGTGKTNKGGKLVDWSGAGWTGQPLMIRYNDELFIIQNAYDHHLKKIRVSDGTVVDQHKFNNVLKGTGTIWTKYDDNNNLVDFYILQGSRRGLQYTQSTPVIQSYRGIAFSDMQDVWMYNSKKMRSYSRDVDGSALILNDTAYLGLENGLFIVFSPDPDDAVMTDGMLQPLIYDVDTLFYPADANTHGGNLVTESSPTYLNGRIYISSGSGHVFGYNLKTKGIDWVFDTGSDMDGSPVVSSDSCILITIEKQYISGQGGVMKLNPSLPPNEAVVWYFPTKNKNFASWKGGIIGSCGISDSYNIADKLAVFVAIDSFLYVVKYDEFESNKMVFGPMKKFQYPTPKLVFKYETGPSISTPIFVGNKLIVATYNGVYLFEYDKDFNFKLLDHQDLGSFEATPFVWNKKIYVAGRDGLLYCFGK